MWSMNFVFYTSNTIRISQIIVENFQQDKDIIVLYPWMNSLKFILHGSPTYDAK